MRRETVGEIVFWSATAFALALYGLTVPDGLPWNASASLACGAMEAGVPLPHPVWRYFVQMSSGHFVVLSMFAAAVSAGLLGAVANRYFGWRVGVASALVWTAFPWVWNRAITGERDVCLSAAAVIAVWAMNAVLLRVTRRARVARRTDPTVAGPAGGDLLGSPTAHDESQRRARTNGIASWTVLGLSVLFVLVSASVHDYRLGEAASAYAKLVVNEAGNRIIVLSGIADEQVLREAKGKCVRLREGEANRRELLAMVRQEWPADTNLWVAAQIGQAAFAEVAVRTHPDRFYVMTGSSTTPEKWMARWSEMTPYLGSCDPFVPAMRRAFAYEGNALGNERQEAGKPKDAWALYWRVFTEVEPGNPAACVNLDEMLKRGFHADEQTRMRIESARADFTKRLADRRKVAETAARLAAFGPVMRDERAYEELRARVAKRLAELEREGLRPDPLPDLRTLGEWHADMMKAYYAKDLDEAVRIARAILARRRWRSFVPAHLVMGTAMAAQGDYVSSEAFYRVAIAGKGAAAPAPFVHNEYAEVLRRLGRLDEAEAHARKAMADSDEKEWVFRLTLAQVLRDARKNPDEVKALVGEAMKHAPRDARMRIRKEFPL